MRGQQRLLHRVLAQVELARAIPAQQRAEDLRRRRAQQVLERGRSTHMSAPAENITGRSSSAKPSIFASGIFFASSIARSFDSTSSR